MITNVATSVTIQALAYYSGIQKQNIIEVWENMGFVRT